MPPGSLQHEDVLIRPATPGDAGEILTLQRAAWVSEAQLHEWFFIPPLTQTLDGVLADIAEQTVLVAVAGHRLIGTVRARLDGTAWYIGRLGIVPDLQRRGIGPRLLAEIEAAAPAAADRFELTTGPKSVDNIAFYERRGYHRVPSDDELAHLAKPHDIEETVP